MFHISLSLILSLLIYQSFQTSVSPFRNRINIRSLELEQRRQHTNATGLWHHHLAACSKSCSQPTACTWPARNEVTKAAPSIPRPPKAALSQSSDSVTVREGLRFLLAIWQIKDQQLCWCSPPPSWTASKIPEEKWTNFIEIRYKNHNKTQKSWSCQHRHHHRWRTHPISTELSSSYLNMSLGHYQVPQLTAPAISQQLLLKAWKRNLWHQTTAWDCSWTSKSREHRCLRTVLPLHQCLLKAQTKDEKHLLKSYCNES